MGWLIVGLFFLSILFFSNRLFRNYIINEDIKKFVNLASDLEIVSLGSGPGKYDLNFNKVRNAENLCVWPEDFRYDYRLLDEYKENLKAGAAIIHVISPLSFAKNDYLNQETFSKKYVYVLKKEKVDVKSSTYIFEKYFPSVIHPKTFARWLFKRKKNNAYLEKRDGKALADDMVNGWLATNPYLKNFKDEGQSMSIVDDMKHHIEYLKKIVEICDNNNFQYFPILAPMSAYLKEKFSEQFLDEFLYNNLREARILNRCINFLTDSRFEDDELYINGLFLNEKGNELLTKTVLEKINGGKLCK